MTGWRGAALGLIALVALALLVVLAVWVAIGLGVLGGVVWLNLVLLPRLSRRLHVPVLAVEGVCLPLLGGSGWLLGGATGAVLGTLAWAAGVGLPRLAGRGLRARVQSASVPPGRVIVVDSPALREPAGRGSNTTP
ncbi:MAG: hypothetical protein M3069_09200 [Chloroflexota bacterium]|nr:hypothetical protein [Chloroflexota bacterium]